MTESLPTAKSHLNSSSTLGPVKVTVLESDPHRVEMRALEVEVPEYKAMKLEEQRL